MRRRQYRALLRLETLVTAAMEIAMHITQLSLVPMPILQELTLLQDLLLVPISRGIAIARNLDKVTVGLPDSTFCIVKEQERLVRSL